MAQISAIRRKDILEAGRLDAEYFKLEYLKIGEALKKVKSRKLKDFIGDKNVFSGPFGSTLKSESYTSAGVPFIRIADIQDIFIDKTNLVYISDEEHQKLLSTSLGAGDIVLSKIGTVGKLSLITSDLGKVNISENNIGLRLSNLKWGEKRFLLFFLLSRYGKKQLLRYGSGNIQLKLNVRDIENVLIPIKTNFNYYQNIYEKMMEKHEKAKQLQKEAEYILLQELDLVGYEPKYTLAFGTNKKNIENAKRFDAEYFQPKYEDIVEKIESYREGFDFVKNISTWQKGIEVGSGAYTERGKGFVRISDFSVYGIEKTSRNISEELFQNLKKNFQPQEGEILFTKDGTVGLSHVLKEKVDGIISSAFLRVTLKKEYQNFKKECLSLIFNSIVCKMQIERLSGGAIINHLKPSDFEKTRIPLIKEKIQRQIAEKVQKSHKLRRQGKELLDLAKRKVEEEIEKV